MADIPNFEISGCSICTVRYGAFFSFTDIRRNSSSDEYKDFCSKFAEFIVNHQSRIWAYNLQFEQQVSFRYFGIDVELCDSAVYNIIEGFHSKRYSLKWTAQRVLNSRIKCQSGIKSWDDDFDYLNDVLNKMYWKEIPNPENPKEMMRVSNCSIDDFDQTLEFQEVCNRYPGYVDEFKLLIRENFGNTFMNIPSAILGYYCNLDAAHTLFIRDLLRDDYSETCVSIYLDNVRLGASLHSGGMYKDVEYHARYQEQCNKMMAYGITYSATVYCKLQLDYLKGITKDIDKYNNSCKLLLGRGEFMKGEVIKIAKHIISNNLSDLYESGLDEVRIYDVYGSDIYNALIEGLKDTNTKADASLMRKKKQFIPIGDRLTDALGLKNLHPDENLEKYMFYDMAYEQFLEIWNNQMPDIDHIPNEFMFLGVKYQIRDYVDMVKKKYFPCTSPKEYEVILEFLMERYKIESAFLSMIYNNLNRVDIKPIFDQLYAGMTIEQAYDHFVNNIYSYPQELKDIVMKYLSDPMGERMTDTFDDGRGFWKQADYWDYIRKDYKTLSEPYSESDFKDVFKFLRKFCIMQCLFKKYVKVDSTYINGLFKGFDRVVHDTPKLVPDVRDETRNDNVVKMFPRYLVCEKDTKRYLRLPS